MAEIKMNKVTMKRPDDSGKTKSTHNSTQNQATTNLSSSVDSSGNSSRNRSSSGISFAEKMGLGSNFYDDDRNMSAQESAQYLNQSSLFQQNKTDKIGTDGQTMNGMNCVANGGRYKVTMDTDGDGIMEEVTCAEAMAASYDSELDLYIDAVVSEIIGKYGSKFYTGDGFLSDEAIAELEAKGIKVDKINNRTYTFSLVDEEGNILEDANGKKGSILFGDWVIPDGYAQGAEIHLSSMLDNMGYDCISRADFVGHEKEYFEMLEMIGEGIENGDFASSDKKVTDIYGEVNTSWSGGGFASGDTNVEGTEYDGNITEAEIEAKAKEEQKEQNKDIQKYFDKIFNQKDTQGVSDEELKEIKSNVAQKVADILKIDVNYVLKIVK